MYCKNCKHDIPNSSSLCPICGAPVNTVSDVTAPQQVYSPSPQTAVRKKTLQSCAWFAPVAVILGAIVNVCITLMWNHILNKYDLSTSVVGFHSGSAVVTILHFFLPLLFFALPYFIAVDKIDRNKQKIILPILLIPVFLSSIPSVLADSFSNLGFAFEIESSQIAIIIICNKVLFTIVITIVSFLIASSYLKSVDSVFDNVTEKVSNSSKPEVSFAVQQSAQFTAGTIQVSPKSKTVAALLCFFFGYLGIHRFYTGKIGTGLLWMFTGGLFGIGEVIDFIIIIFGGFKDSNELPLS